MSNRSPAVAVAAYPLAQLACVFALGVLAGTFLFKSLWFFIYCGALISAGAIVALMNHKSRLAATLVLFATLLLGSAFAIVEKSNIPPNQIRRLLDEGTIKVGDPVELTGVLDQEPEPAPERLFLRLTVRRVRAGNTEMQTSG